MHKTIIKILALFILGLFALSVSGCSRGVIARVNGEKILKNEFYEKLERFGAPQAPLNAGQAMMVKMIQDKLILQFAAEKGVPATDQQVDARFDRMRKQAGANFQAQLQQQSMTPEDLKEALRVAQAQINVRTKDVQVSGMKR